MAVRVRSLYVPGGENNETNFSVADATGYLKMLKKMTPESLQTYTLPGEPKYISGVSYFVYDTQETKQLILEKFGYPEDEAKALKEQQKKEEKSGDKMPEEYIG